MFNIFSLTSNSDFVIINKTSFDLLLNVISLSKFFPTINLNSNSFCSFFEGIFSLSRIFNSFLLKKS